MIKHHTTTDPVADAYDDWYEAFREHGRNQNAATHLANECETWLANNPAMSWQDIFDAVLLSDETTGA